MWLTVKYIFIHFGIIFIVTGWITTEPFRVGFYPHNDTRSGDDDNNSNKTRGGCGNFGNVIYLSTFACTTVSL